MSSTSSFIWGHFFLPIHFKACPTCKYAVLNLVLHWAFCFALRCTRLHWALVDWAGSSFFLSRAQCMYIAWMCCDVITKVLMTWRHRLSHGMIPCNHVDIVCQMLPWRTKTIPVNSLIFDSLSENIIQSKFDIWSRIMLAWSHITSMFLFEKYGLSEYVIYSWPGLQRGPAQG